MTVSTVGTAGATGTGVTLTAPLTLAHASGAQVNTSMKVEVDFSGGNQEIVLVTNVGTAGAGGTGVTSRRRSSKAHVLGVTGRQRVGQPGGPHRRHRRRPARPAAASGLGSGHGLRSRVVVPVQANGVSCWTSNDCGAHWSAETQILPNMTATHTVAQGIRTSLLPTSADGRGGEHLRRVADAELPRRQRRPRRRTTSRCR